MLGCLIVVGKEDGLVDGVIDDVEDEDGGGVGGEDYNDDGCWVV